MAKAKKIIYPRQTAIWLRDNTQLSTGQVARFCSLVEEEVIFAREPSTFNPINVNISQDEIETGEKNPKHKLKPLHDFSAFQTKRPRKKCQMNVHKYKKPSYFKYILANNEHIDAYHCKKLICFQNIFFCFLKNILYKEQNCVLYSRAL